MNVRHNLNGTLGNFSGDVKSLEEGSLLGSHAGVLCLNHHIDRSDSSGSRGGSNLVFKELISDSNGILLGEDEAHVSLNVRKQLLKVWVVGNVRPKGFAHHRILAHEDL